MLAAHALAEKLWADGLKAALAQPANARLGPALERAAADACRHAVGTLGLLGQLELAAPALERLWSATSRSASFAPLGRFARGGLPGAEFAVAAQLLLLAGLLMVGVNYCESSYDPHRELAGQILEEAAEHEKLFAAGLEAGLEPDGVEALEQALGRWLPAGLDCFGPPGSGFCCQCLRFGLKAVDNGELAGLFGELVQRRFAALGVKCPPVGQDYPRAAV